ncbi:hypothetical protein KKI22_01395 [Patescibacteria group bacterium]|nr:hypothetical protein [Patescibacteria group bacterium]
MSEKLRNTVEFSKENVNKINMATCLEVAKQIDPRLNVKLEKNTFTIIVNKKIHSISENKEYPDKILITIGKTEVCSFQAEIPLSINEVFVAISEGIKEISRGRIIEL